MPVFFILNGLFFIYWGFQFKKRMILSGIVLLIGITFINKFISQKSIHQTIKLYGDEL
jgi:hypothetical protein